MQNLKVQNAMNAMRPQPRPGVLDIDAYVPGKSKAPSVTIG